MKKNYEWKKIGVAGVDSGQLIVCDPCYIEHELPAYKKMSDKTDNGGTTKQLNFKMGHAGAGVIFTSGFGDGVYPVYAKFENFEEEVNEYTVRLNGGINLVTTSEERANERMNVLRALKHDCSLEKGGARITEVRILMGDEELDVEMK